MPHRSSSLVWLIALLAALGFLAWMNETRIDRIERVSDFGGWGDRRLALPSRAPSAAGAKGHGLIIPEQNSASYHWIIQTQRMLQRGEGRVRHIDYENAPFGRAVHAPSPYRWWLGFVTWCHHLVSGQPVGRSIEWAALIADPLLHLLAMLVTAVFVAWRFGAFPSALLSVGFVTLFPFATEFLPGLPSDRGLTQIITIWSVLLLAVGVGVATPAPVGDRTRRRCFFLAGALGGLGLWLDVRAQIPILAGVAAGALLAAGVARKTRQVEAGSVVIPSWRHWAMGGAICTLGAYLVEFAPDHLGDWQLSSIHPLHGLAWLGGGEILAQVAEWEQGAPFRRTRRQLASLIVALGALVSLPVVIWKIQGSEYLVPEAASFQLTRLPEGAVAESLWSWVVRDGMSAPMGAALLPLLLLVPVAWLISRRLVGKFSKTAVALTLGPVLVACCLACRHLSWWSTLDGLLLVTCVVAVGASSGVIAGRRSRFLFGGLVLLLLAPGIWQMIPRPAANATDSLTRAEVLGLVERDLADWITRRAQKTVVVLAPPNESTALCYYGGMRGIGSLSWENREGVAAAVRILSAPSFQEAKELIDRRQVTHLVLLSWDSYFDEFARAGTGQSEGSFRAELSAWRLPPWLRPLAYRLPIITGFEGQTATIYEVVETQDEATALGRMAEYFVEMGDLDRAAEAAQALRRFPADFGASVARAEVELARGDEAEFARSLKVLQSRLAARNAPPLPWDLRVGLSVLLAKAKQPKLAREQVATCLKNADEKKIRGLSTGALYRLLVLSRGFEVPVEARLRELALDLLPVDLRERLR